MLFLFRGKHGPLVRTMLGVVLLVAGLLHKGWLILAAIGTVLVIWGVVGLVSAQRIGHRASRPGNGRKP
jgi:hypothetical protein